MKFDGFTLLTGALALAAAGIAAWQWTAPAPPPPDPGAPPASVQPPAAAPLAAALARLQPAQVDISPSEQETAPQRALRLIGVVESDDGRVAVIAADGETLFLRLGDEAAGVELLALDQSLAVVATSQGQRRLALGG